MKHDHKRKEFKSDQAMLESLRRTRELYPKDHNFNLCERTGNGLASNENIRGKYAK